MTPTCILSPYAKNREDGYGAIYHEGKHMNHSRVVYLLHNNVTNDSIKNLVVRHTCDVPACINPDHLVLGTHKDNMQDKVAKGRWTGGQPKKLSEAAVLDIRTNGGTPTYFAAKYGVSIGTVANVVNYRSCYNDRS